MAQKRPLVPKFGNFEGDNDVPYTAYFEKALNDKGNVVRMNPNDPEENPEAFNSAKKGNQSGSDNFSQNHRRSNSRSVASESGSESNSDNFVNRNKGNRLRNSSNGSDMSYASASVPKFGAWDEKDPASGEGFTVIFNRVKEEKQIAASKFPLVPPQVVTHTEARKENSNRSKSKMCFKKWCCLSPREKDY